MGVSAAPPLLSCARRWLHVAATWSHTALLELLTRGATVVEPAPTSQAHVTNTRHQHVISTHTHTLTHTHKHIHTHKLCLCLSVCLSVCLSLSLSLSLSVSLCLSVSVSVSVSVSLPPSLPLFLSPLSLAPPPPPSLSPIPKGTATYNTDNKQQDRKNGVEGGG